MMSVSRQHLGPYDLRVWRQGEGEGLLYLHGTERHTGDAPFLRRLADERTVLAPEFPGYGESLGLGHIHDIHDITLLLREFIEISGYKAVDVVGHSLGGMVAAELAIVAPQLVRCLVLVDSYGLWIDDEPMPDAFAMTPLELENAKWYDPDKKSLETHPRDGSTPLDLAVERARNSGTATKFLWPIPDRGLRRRIRYLSTPTLVVHGDSDGLVPLRYAEELARLLPNSELVTISHAGHMPMFEAEDDFVAAVQKFLAQHQDRHAQA